MFFCRKLFIIRHLRLLTGKSTLSVVFQYDKDQSASARMAQACQAAHPGTWPKDTPGSKEYITQHRGMGRLHTCSRAGSREAEVEGTQVPWQVHHDEGRTLQVPLKQRRLLGREPGTLQDLHRLRPLEGRNVETTLLDPNEPGKDRRDDRETRAILRLHHDTRGM